jgi:hypothetical protein
MYSAVGTSLKNGKIGLPSVCLGDPEPVFGLTKTATAFLGCDEGGLPLPRLTPASDAGEGGDPAAASMTADATADAARTGRLLTCPEAPAFLLPLLLLEVFGVLLLKKQIENNYLKTTKK